MTRTRKGLRTPLHLAALVALLAALLPLAASPPLARAASNTLTLRVVSARTEPANPNGPVQAGDAVTAYRFIINADNVGDPDQSRSPDCSPSDTAYPANCHWPSIQAQRGDAPIVTQGDQSDLNATTGLTLPPGKYLISVLGDGYKLDGAHFSVPLEGSGLVTVEAQPLPLPTATVRVKVFEDNAPVNSGPDMPAERGLAGFRGVIADTLGEVTTDVFGNQLCTKYVLVNGAPDPEQPIPGSGGVCLSDDEGDLVIPNLGPNRYAVSVVPPDTSWIQTTTLEGNHDYDTWVQEGATGYDTEFSVAGEAFPATFFGFVHRAAFAGSAAGHIKGLVAAAKVYVPPTGGLPYSGGYAGAKVDHPIDRPWIALSDLNRGDQAVFVGQGNPDGTFDIANVPDGDYTLTYWDEDQSYLLDFQNMTVRNGQTVDAGVLLLTGWFTTITGTVFNDVNGNGKQDAGEGGIAGQAVSLKRRTNSLMDRGTVTVVTDSSGHYAMENTYPMTQWLVQEVYNDRYYTTGVTYQADNQDTETTVLGAGVDLNVLPIIGLSGRVDWGIKLYDATGRNGGPRNGGIVGTVSYDTTRNELDPRFAAVEDWQPGVPGLAVKLYKPLRDPSTGQYLRDPDGAYTKGPQVGEYETEHWARPKDCQARDVDGNPVDQQVLPPATGGYDCLEAPMAGVQFDEEFATVDGNYGFTTVWRLDGSGQPIADPDNPGGYIEDPMPAGDYLVDVEIPNDDVLGKPLYKFTREEDINVFSGDQYVPQVPPPPCVGPLHTVDVAGIAPDGPDAVENPTFVENGGSPYEGQQRPACNVKLVTVGNGRSIAPTFNVFTDVPVPGRFFGYIVDDLNLSTNPRDLLFGEKAGVANVPVGIYDYANRLVTTVNSDPNGIYEVLLPSTSTISCPSPSGVCTNLYRQVGNDPGVPGRLNPNYNPQFRTIAATFELFPGDIIPADLAPTRIGVAVTAPGAQLSQPATCSVDATQPQLFAVSQPYVVRSANGDTTNPGTITITGLGFGAAQGSGKVLLGALAQPVVSWSDRQIVVRIQQGGGAPDAGQYPLSVVANNGLSTINGLTFHVLRPSDVANRLYEVGANKPFHTIQAALDAAAANYANPAKRQALVVVYPGGVPDSANPAYNPQKAYFENLLISTPVKLQGVGPGGVYPNGSVVEGSLIDGAAFGGDTALADAWRTKVDGLTWSGNQTVYEGAVVTILAQQGRFTDSYPAAIDGFGIQGGDQRGFPNNINEIGGGPTGLPPNTETQGGGIFANAYARALQITNNLLQSNGGTFGGAIRLGTPDLPAPNTSNHNENVRIANNRIIANGGTNLAGAIGVFAGADGYEIAANQICGNFSAEYGGAISHYGLSPDGSIHDNRIYFNQSYDEGGGIMIAGQLPANPHTLSPGAGAVRIFNNIIEANLSNDDGGGIRFLMAGNFRYDVTNNMVVNNISTHEGGGIAIDDAPGVRIVNNTIMKNITTATAATSNGQAAPAGVSTTSNSVLLQATLPASAPTYGKPVLFNNIFWDNRAGSASGSAVRGIGLAGDNTPLSYWDAGVADGAGLLEPTNSVLQTPLGTAPDASNRSANPVVSAEYSTSVATFPWRTNPGIIGATIVAVDLPLTQLGNYHLTSGSTEAIDRGAASKLVGAVTVSAPARDIDNQPRPAGPAFDIGADEFAATGTVFPTTAVLDNFNRLLLISTGNWGSTATNSFVAYFLASNQLRAIGTNAIYWRRNTFGANQEAYITFAKTPAANSSQGLLLKLDGLGTTGLLTNGSHGIRVRYNSAPGTVTIETLTSNQQWVARATITGMSFVAGDTLGVLARADGGVVVYQNSVQIGSANVTSGTNAWPASYAAAGGRIGITASGVAPASDARFDNFGGGNAQ